MGFILFALGSCKGPAKQETPENIVETPEKTLPELLAYKHGFENWKDVQRIRFTFNIDRDTSHYERSWIWDVRENRVTRMSEADTISYLRSEVDSTLMRVDGSFINDKFWFLAPYQWVWDSGSFTHSYQEDALAPISGDSMPKLTIVYGNEGGYTPGDAYDFYLGRDSLVREWVFRRGNQPEPSVITTWEGYQKFQGLNLSTRHENAEGSLKFYFTGIAVE
ncbi:MAG: hypothetical protein P8X60_09880 [Robiginitalea sp.]